MQQLGFQALLDEVNRDIEGRLRTIAELQQELDGLRQLAAYLERKLASQPTQSSTSTPEPASMTATDPLPQPSVPVATPVPSVPPPDFANMTQIDAAEAVLREVAPRPLKIGEIIDRMHERGFPHRVDRHVLFNSLYTAMKKARGRFRKIGEFGRGLWGLADAGAGNDEEPTLPGMDDDPDDFDDEIDSDTEGDDGSPHRLSYTEAAEYLIGRHRRPIKTAEVADYMIEKGYKDALKRRFIRNTVYNCLSNSSDFVKTQDGEWDLADRTHRRGRDESGSRSTTHDHAMTR